MLKHLTLRSMTGVSLLGILVISGGVYAVLAGEKGPNRIFGPFIISASGEELAFRVGTLGPKEKFPSVEPKTCVLKLGKDATRLIPVSRSFVPMAWRPGATPPELFGAVWSHEPGTPDRISAVAVSDSVSTVSSQALPGGLSVFAMAWNPSGQILAARVSKLTDKGIYFYLGISYDNGKTINVTDIVLSESPVWINNEILCIQDGNNILEVDVSNRTPCVMRTIASGDDIPAKNFYFYIAGGLDGNVLYVLSKEVYCGDQLLYRSNQSINQIIANGSYVVFKAGSHVYVLDGKGNVINKKSVEKNTTKLIALSSVHKFVYLIKNYQSIQRYSFTDSDKISTVYDVTD